MTRSSISIILALFFFISDCAAQAPSASKSDAQPQVLTVLAGIVRVGPIIEAALEHEGKKIDRRKIIDQIDPNVEKVQSALSRMQFFNDALITNLKKTPYDRHAVQVDLEDLRIILQSVGHDISAIRQVIQPKLSNDDLMETERMAEDVLVTKGIEINELLRRLGLLKSDPSESGAETEHLDLITGANNLNAQLKNAQRSFAQVHSKLDQLKD